MTKHLSRTRTDAYLTQVSRFSLHEHWRPGRVHRSLLLFEGPMVEGAFLVSEASAAAEALACRLREGAAVGAREAATMLDVPVLDVAGPLPLQPVVVSKAWGEERWFTGIEARGVAGIGEAQLSVPLPWVLAARPVAFGNGLPILTKVLAPDSEPATGDLYFEIHRQKEEVYVVTGIDSGAWPEGQGYVRYGLAPAARETLGADGLRRLFATAAYVHARAQHALGSKRTTAKGPPMDQLFAQVQRARVQLDALTNMRALRIGDVIHVPPQLPHGLMHGVRVIEFQTPDYERRVLYASQPLPLPNRATIMDLLHEACLDVPADSCLSEGTRAQGVSVSLIARMRDFDVYRLTLEADAMTMLPEAAYGVLMGVSGRLHCGDLELAEEEGALLPGPALPQRLEARGEPGAGLFAIPN